MSGIINSLKNLASGSKVPGEDTNMRFSPSPRPGDSGFNQWRDAMKMVAKLPGGIPPEFRKKLWLALAEKHLQSKGVNWSQTEKFCFNEWSNPDDSELGIQIVKDLHRTGCSLFCGTAGQENQALLKRVLLAYARWNKSVGYCQGFNMLAALILQVMDKSEVDSVKVMIYLIEGVLPESYFANNLRGLSVDMIVFRDLLKLRLPLLSKHLEFLQNEAREGNSYEPPLTNVFTMQWFLTLFCNCLPQPTVLRVWDLIFLEGNEILLRTAIAIWEKLSDRILAVNSADEFYSIMGVLTREMLEFGLVDTNTLIKSIVAIGHCSELNEMRDKYMYNITPWTQSVHSAAKKGFKMFYSDDDDMDSDYDEKAAVTTMYGMALRKRREKQASNSSSNISLIQPYAHGHPDRERLALDISALKKQYAKLRERQRQAHIILQAACARQPISQNPSSQPIAMNHLLLGKNAIISSSGKRLGPVKGSIPPVRKKESLEEQASGETIHWKDTAKIRPSRRSSCAEIEDNDPVENDSSSYSEDDASSTSTELCDEPGKLNDFDTDTSHIDLQNKDNNISTTILEDVKTEENVNTETLIDLTINTSELASENILEETITINNNFSNDLESEIVTNYSVSNITNNCDNIIQCEKESFSPRLISDTFNDILSNEEENLVSAIEKVDDEETKTNCDLKENILQFHNCDFVNKTVTSFTEIVPKSSISSSLDSSKFTNLEYSSSSNIFSVEKLDYSESCTSENIDHSENIKENETIDDDGNKAFEEFFQDRLKMKTENVEKENIISPIESYSWRHSEDKLRKYKSYEEPKTNFEEKFSIYKQSSFDISGLPTIETSLWTPHKIEEESWKQFEDTSLNVNNVQEDLSKILQKQASIGHLTVEDKRLETGRRNSERALKIIQENSMILHRILQHQRSSEKEESDDELSRSPISKTFLRSESLLSKDEKTDEERSSKDGDDELESGVESFSVSPVVKDDDNDFSKNNISDNDLKMDNQFTNTENFESFNSFLNYDISSLTETKLEDIIESPNSQNEDKTPSYVKYEIDFCENENKSNSQIKLKTPIEDKMKLLTEETNSILERCKQSNYKSIDFELNKETHISQHEKTQEELQCSSKIETVIGLNYFNTSSNNNFSSLSYEEKYSTSIPEKLQNFQLTESSYSSNLLTNKNDNLTCLSYDEKNESRFEEKETNYFQYSTETAMKTFLSPEERQIQEFQDSTETEYSQNTDFFNCSYSSNFSNKQSSLFEEEMSQIKEKQAQDFQYLTDNETLIKTAPVFEKKEIEDFQNSVEYETKTNLFDSSYYLNLSCSKNEESWSLDNIYNLKMVKDELDDVLRYPNEEKETFDFEGSINNFLDSNEKDFETFSLKEEDKIDDEMTVGTKSAFYSKTWDSSKSSPFLDTASSSNLNESDNNLEASAQAQINPHSSYNKKNLSIDLKPSTYSDYSPEISPPKHLSCLQFTTFQADIPCSSKAIQLSPICAKDKQNSPSDASPNKTPKYLSSFNLPTLTPPKKSLKSPFSPGNSFSPFPVQPTTRQPKEIGVKLGLYKDLSPLKSPNK